MPYVVEAISRGRSEGFFRAEKSTPIDAVETACDLLEQGMDHFTITDEAGRVYTATDFHELIDVVATDFSRG